MVLGGGVGVLALGAVAIPLFSLAAVVLWCCGCAVIPLFLCRCWGVLCGGAWCTCFRIGVLSVCWLALARVPLFSSGGGGVPVVCACLFSLGGCWVLYLF